MWKSVELIHKLTKDRNQSNSHPRNYQAAEKIIQATEGYYSNNIPLIADTIAMPSNHRLTLVHLAEPTGKEIIASFLLMWSGETGNLLKSFSVPRGTNTLSALTHKNMISAYKNTLTIWDIETGAELKTLSLEVSSIRKILRVSAQLVVIASANELHLINLTTNKILHTFKGHSADVRDIIALPNGQIASVDDHNGDIFIWDIEKPSLQYHLDLTQIKPENEQTMHGSTLREMSLVSEELIEKRFPFTLQSFNDGSLVFNCNGRFANYMYHLYLNESLDKWEATVKEIQLPPENNFLVLPDNKIAFQVARANIKPDIDTFRIIDLADDEFKAKSYRIGRKGEAQTLSLQNDGSIISFYLSITDNPKGKYQIGSVLYSYPELDLELNSTPKP